MFVVFRPLQNDFLYAWHITSPSQLVMLTQLLADDSLIILIEEGTAEQWGPGLESGALAQKLSF